MTTRGTLAAEIADDLDRTDLTSQITSAITAAVNFYRPIRFFFNESRTACSFSTVASQDTYTSSDDADIPLMFDVDLVTVTVDDDIRELRHMGHNEMEVLNDADASEGEPTHWTYFNQSFRFYPIPDAVYTVNVIGGNKAAAPASDIEANNVWMVYAYELIHCRAKKYLAAHILRDNELASVMEAAERQALDSLYSETSRRKATGTIRATTF